jgi:hypothetical protein
MKTPLRCTALLLSVTAIVVSPRAQAVIVISQPDFSVSELCARLDRQIAALGAIVMHETISRYDTARGRAGKIDEFDASVEVADGVDSLASLRRNGRPYTGVTPQQGAWAIGDFSTVLRTSREALGEQTMNLVPYSDREPGTLLLTFHCPASSALWFVMVESRIYWLDFQVEMRISTATGDVTEISWTSSPPAADADIRQIRRVVSFAPSEVAGQTYLLPNHAEYCVVHAGNRVEWNTARFGNAARYGALASVRFGE